MKKKYLGLAAIAMLGMAPAANTIASVYQTNTVQAASKKTKFVKFKTYHNQYIWGPYRGKTINLNKIGYYSVGASFSRPTDYVEYPDVGYDRIEGYAKINGKKYYYSRDE